MFFPWPDGHPGTITGDLVLAEPEVTCRDLRRGDGWLVMASDGLWDVLSARRVADEVT